MTRATVIGGLLDQHAEASLLHNDLGPMHVWVDPESEIVASLMDFGERSSGDPMWDIVEYDWEGMGTLLEGYKPDEGTKESFAVKFHVCAVLRAIPWAQKWHSRGETQTIDWLKFTIQKTKDQLEV